MRPAVFFMPLLAAAVSLAGCAQHSAPNPQRSAAAVTPTIVAAAPQTPSSGEVTHLRAELEQARRERDDALAQLQAALSAERRLQAELDRVAHITAPAPSASPNPQIFHAISTAPTVEPPRP